MAVERNPFDKPDEFEIVVDMAPPPQTEESDAMVEDHETNMEFNPDDGSIVVEFIPPEDPRSEVQIQETDEEFHRNLAEDLDDALKEEISGIVVDNFEEERASREEWEQMFEKGFDLLGLKLEETTEPFEGACTAVHPILIESAVKFQSKASQELFPPAGPVKTQILGSVDEQRTLQATRVQTFMNYQLTEQMPEYFEEFERMLFHLSLIGSAFKKTYFDKSMNRPVSEFIPIDQFYVSYYATDLERASHYTHLIFRKEVEMKRDILNGLYIADGLSEPKNPEMPEMRQKIDNIMGLSPSYDGDPHYELLEQHCYLDLPEEFSGDDTGLPLPYIVTVERNSGKVISVRRNYDKEDKRREKKVHFTHYKYVPGFGFYGLGLIHLLGNLTMSATASLRSLIDSGQFANLQGGFKSKGMRFVGDNGPIAPGEFREVEAVGDDLRKMVMPVPFKEPSQTLFNMLGFVSQAAQKFADSTESVIADNASYGPVGTTMALLEASSKFFSAIHKRLHAAQRREFKILARINYEYLPEEATVDIPEDTISVRKNDFDGRIDVIPVSDPNIPSSAHRMMLAQTALQLADSSPPGMFNREELNKAILQAANMPNIDAIMPSKPDSQPLDPVSDIMAAVKGLPIKAFTGQNHDAHMQVKMAYLKDPANGANPVMQRVAPILQSNIQEHSILKYQEQMNGTTQMIMQQNRGRINPNDPKVMEMIMGQAAQQVAQANAQMAKGAGGSPEEQMVQLEAARLAIEKEKVEAQIAKEGVSAAMQNRKLDIEEAKLELDMMKEGIRNATNSQEKERDRNTKIALEALDLMMDLMKEENSADTQKILKAADMITQISKEAASTKRQEQKIANDSMARNTTTTG